MQVYDAYPARAVGGSCLVTKDYDVSNGKRVLSLDIDLANLPTHGLICVSEEAVRQMNVALGWDTDVHGAQRLAELREQVARLEESNAQMVAAIRAIQAAGVITTTSSGPDVIVTVETSAEKPAPKPRAPRKPKPAADS